MIDPSLEISDRESVPTRIRISVDMQGI